jgi:hypothetical protein
MFIMHKKLLALAALAILSFHGAHAALLSHFKGRYGAIEVFDTGKKLSFRVNPPELSSARNFCRVNDLAQVIAGLEAGTLKADAQFARTLGGKSETVTLKNALLHDTPWVFSQLQSQVSAAQVKRLQDKKLAPTNGTAFHVLEWFNALQAGSLALKPGTLQSVKSLLIVKRSASGVMYSFSSRCTEARGAVGGIFGYVERPNAQPIFFAVSVDGKSVSELFGVARNIRDAALTELGYWQAAARISERKF